VRPAVLFGRVEFGGGALEFAQVEHRVIAEAIVAPCLRQNLARPFALGNDRLWVVGVANEDDQRTKTITETKRALR